MLTGAEYLADGLKPLTANSISGDPQLANRDGSDIWLTPQWPIVTDKVRCIGENLAFVVAETLGQARDAAELIAFELEPLPVMADARKAMAAGAATVWDAVPDNVDIDHERGDKAAVDAAFARAHHTTSIDIENNRVTGVPMEPRATLAQYHAATGSLTLSTASQNPHNLKTTTARMLAMPEEKIRVIVKDVGGGYGVRTRYTETILTAWAALRIGRSVKNTIDRSEAFISDSQARDIWTHAELAFEAKGKILAMRVYSHADLGCETIQFTPMARSIAVATGVYHVPLAHATMKGVLTNRVPISVYRGAGRPEAMYVIERLMDKAAQELAIDPVELRRRNLIPVAAIPYANPLATTYDSGEFEKNMDMALALADWSGFAARHAELARRGRMRGIGIANYIEFDDRHAARARRGRGAGRRQDRDRHRHHGYRARPPHLLRADHRRALGRAVRHGRYPRGRHGAGQDGLGHAFLALDARRRDAHQARGRRDR